MHGDSCHGRWCINGDLSARGRPFWVRCVACGVTAMSFAAWAGLDPAAACQAVDPDGLQRAFLEAAGLKPQLSAALRR